MHRKIGWLANSLGDAEQGARDTFWENEEIRSICFEDITEYELTHNQL